MNIVPIFQFYNELFEPLNCLNLGVGGERTEQVCRRLKGGQLNKINPKVRTVHLLYALLLSTVYYPPQQ